MCGRYALGLRPREVCNALQNEGMLVNDGLKDEDHDISEPNYNLAPGNHGLVYLAHKCKKPHEDALERMDTVVTPGEIHQYQIRYKLQTMSWGLIPHWTKQKPDYGFLLKTINCRDDSLIANKPIWNSIKCTKRCVIIAQGFYEWQKNVEKIPHYIHRKDGRLLCLAGLYDSVQIDGKNNDHFTYTIITTQSNEQFKFLHHRMPVILENGSHELRTWLDPKTSSWSMDLQNLLKPSKTELEIYPVSKDVGKLVNNSPKLILPVASSENNSNIANFFSKIRVENSNDPVLSESKFRSSGDVAKSPEQRNLKKETIIGDFEISCYENPLYDERLDGFKEDAKLVRKRKPNHIINDKHQKKIARTATTPSSILKSIPSISGKDSENYQVKSIDRSSNKNKSNKKITDFFEI